MQKKHYFTLPPGSNPRFGRDRQIIATAFYKLALLAACWIAGLLPGVRQQHSTDELLRQRESVRIAFSDGKDQAGDALPH
jgi:hypothetical protein